MLLTATVVLGAVSGFTIRKLGSRRPLGTREARILVALGWVLTALWISLAAGLLVWAIVR